MCVIRDVVFRDSVLEERHGRRESVALGIVDGWRFERGGMDIL